MNISIKKASLEDIEGLSKLFDAYRVFYKQDSNIDLAKDFLSQRLSNEESAIFIATSSTSVEADSQYLGFTQLYPSFSSTTAQRIWILNDLFVNSSARGNGVAKQLMEKARQHAIDTKSKGLSLATTNNNEIAQNLYESLGYQKNTDYYHYFLAV